MYSFKEKKTHFVALRNPDVAQYDLELLAKEVPGFPQLATFSRNPKRYADDILYALLDCATREEIREYRRAMIAKKAKEAEETGPHDDIEKPETAPADNSAEELKQALEEAEARAEEAEQRADEAEEARDEAEARAQETEQALEEEKKKEPAKVPVKSKSKRNTRKSTGTTSSTRKSK